MNRIIYLLISFTVTLIACRSTKNLAGVNKKDFVEEFKALSFCRCMENSSNKNFDLAKEDVSCRFPDFMYGQFNFIDSLSNIEVIKIKQDSIQRIDRVGEGMGGKIIFYNCLKYMNSKGLLKIAKSRFRLEARMGK